MISDSEIKRFFVCVGDLWIQVSKPKVIHNEEGLESESFLKYPDGKIYEGNQYGQDGRTSWL